VYGPEVNNINLLNMNVTVLRRGCTNKNVRIELAQDRVQWRALAEAVLSCQGVGYWTCAAETQPIHNLGVS
jgi:hypothetical protein